MSIISNPFVRATAQFPAHTTLVGSVPHIAAGVGDAAFMKFIAAMEQSPIGVGFRNTHADFIGGGGFEDNNITAIVVNSYGLPLNGLLRSLAFQVANYNAICLWIGYDGNGYANQIVPMNVPHFRYGKQGYSDNLPSFAIMWDGWAGGNDNARANNFYSNQRFFKLFSGRPPMPASVEIEANSTYAEFIESGAGYRFGMKYGLGEILYATADTQSNSFYAMPPYFAALELLLADNAMLQNKRADAATSASIWHMRYSGAIDEPKERELRNTFIAATTAGKGAQAILTDSTVEMTLHSASGATTGNSFSSDRAELRETMMVLYNMPATVARVQTAGKLGNMSAEDRQVAFEEYNSTTAYYRELVGGVLAQIAAVSSILPKDANYTPLPKPAPMGGATTTAVTVPNTEITA